ncbi:MAG TPA: OmpA family protein [Polyangia bacterium]|jgi:outer membrane protein OmpA-like peptidoglycan-associated protein
MRTASYRLIRWLAAPPALAMWLGACSTPPKPTALVSYEDLKRDPSLEDTRRRFPDLVGASDQYGERATKEWQSNNLEDSTRAALLAEIKLKTALARDAQEQAKARLQTVNADQAKADEALASVDKDLGAMTEQVKLMEKNVQAEADKKRLTEQLASDQKNASAEREKLSAQLTTEEKRAAAQLALRTADTVDAGKYAAAEYGAASSMLAKADAEIKQGNWGAAQASLDVAKSRADHATELSKPSYEQAAQASQNKARDEALRRDASSLPGVAVRLEQRGELQRLVIAIQDLFSRNQTTLQPGRDDSLAPVAQLISKYPSYPVQVVGHTDNRGRAGELIALSQARAQSVFSSLVSKGVEARRLMVSGQGPNEPIADNKSAPGRAKNSRVEIIFLYH